MNVVPRKDKGFLPLAGPAGRLARRRRQGPATSEGLDNATALLRLDS